LSLTLASIVGLGFCEFLGIIGNTPARERARLVVIQLSRTLFILISKLYELGGFESGLVAYLLGLVFAVVSGGVVLAVVTIWPGIRKYGRLDA
jgi:hypothetical protein